MFVKITSATGDWLTNDNLRFGTVCQD